MKESNRGKLYKLCLEYVKYADVRSEIYLLDLGDGYEGVIETMDGLLSEYEAKMLMVLGEE